MKDQKDLLEQIDNGHVECLNENPDRPWSYALKQGYREDDGLVLEETRAEAWKYLLGVARPEKSEELSLGKKMEQEYLDLEQEVRNDMLGMACPLEPEGYSCARRSGSAGRPALRANWHARSKPK